MWFTVRRPPVGEVSPCNHRPSGGDIPCSVHVGIASAGRAGLALEDGLALAVPRCDVPTRGASLRRVRGRDPSTRPNALSCKRRTSWPQPLRLIERLSPRFWATPEPGCSTVPRAERVIARTSRASTLITSNRRARPVLVFSTQSRRRSLSRAFSFAIASLVFSRRREPRLARASLCCNTLNRFDSAIDSRGAYSRSPVDSAADTARRQHLFLLGSRQQTEPRHNRTVTATTDTPARSKSKPFAIGPIETLTSEVYGRRRH